MNTVTEEKVRATVEEAFHQIAPEVDLAEVDPHEEIQEQVDMDSVDLLNLVVLLHEKLSVEIPESDYEELSTLHGMIQYLSARVEEEP